MLSAPPRLLELESGALLGEEGREGVCVSVCLGGMKNNLLNQ